MILPDANLLLYAYDESSPHHDAARAWLEDLLSQPEPCALCWPVLLAFLRIGTDPRAFRRPLTLAEGAAIVAEWLGWPTVRMLTPGDRHWQLFQSALSGGQARGRLVMDAHLAALAVEHGAVLATADRDFARFPDLKVVYPLSEERG